MQVILDLPEDLAHLLGHDAPSLSRNALEALALEGIRSGKLSEAQARRLLGISTRYEMDGFLKQHGVVLSMTIEDIGRDIEEARRFLTE